MIFSADAKGITSFQRPERRRKKETQRIALKLGMLVIGPVGSAVTINEPPQKNWDTILVIVRKLIV